MSKLALITGYGHGLAGCLARRLLEADYSVVGLRRSGRAEPDLSGAGTFRVVACDVGDQTAVTSTVQEIQDQHGEVDVLIHNASEPILEDFLALTADQCEALWRTTFLGAFHVSQAVLPGMLARGNGTLIYSGATASVKAGPKSAAFAGAKFALRGLAQSLARAYGPQGIHVAHTIIDGVIWGDRAKHRFGMQQQDCMDADDIAASYMALIEQPASAWTHELDLRPSKEAF